MTPGARRRCRPALIVLALGWLLGVGPPALAAPAVFHELQAVGIAGSGTSASGALFLRTEVEDPHAGWRLFLEGCGEAGSAYGYGTAGAGHLDLEEAYAELGRETRVRVGRFRLPFGIYERADSNYYGFIEAPLARAQMIPYSYRSSHLSRPLQPFGALGEGTQLTFGRPELNVRLALFEPDDADGAAFRPLEARSVTARAQAFIAPWIIGISTYQGHSREWELWPGRLATARYWGVDWRYARPALIVRGEYLGGAVGHYSPSGGYLDAVIHPSWLGKASLLLRAERYEVRGYGVTRRQNRGTVGVKWMAAPWLMLAANLRTSGGWYQGDATAVRVQAVTTSRF